MGSTTIPAASGGKTTKGVYYTNSGNFTAPSNTNFVTAVVVGAGSGGGAYANDNQSSVSDSGAGGSSSFHNITATGGTSIGGVAGSSGRYNQKNGANGALGKGGGPSTSAASIGTGGSVPTIPTGQDGARIEATIAVTPGTTYSVTVGSGGAGCFTNIGAIGGTGGNGFVSLTYEE